MRLVTVARLDDRSPMMTLPRGAAEVLESHVSLEVECLDRAYLNVYQPKLQFAGGLVQFLRGHRGNPIAVDSAGHPTKGFVADIQRYAKDHGLGIVAFERGQRKDDLAAKHRGRLRGDRRGVSDRPCPGEDQSVPHRETPEPTDREKRIRGSSRRRRSRTTTTSVRSTTT